VARFGRFFKADPLGMEGGEATAWPALVGMGGGFGAFQRHIPQTAAAGGWRDRMPASWRGACRTGFSVCRPSARVGIAGTVTAPQPVAAQDDVIFNEPGRGKP